MVTVDSNGNDNGIGNGTVVVTLDSNGNDNGIGNGTLMVTVTVTVTTTEW